MPGRRDLLARHAGRLVRYATGSGVATVCSAVAFFVVYALGAGTTAASLLGWLAGAVPNYLLNRAWVWRVGGRPDVRREVVPYVVVVLVTLALATGATALTEDLLEGAGAAGGVVTAGVNVAFLGVYALMALVRYALLHLVFRRLPGRTGPPARPARPDRPDRPARPGTPPTQETR